MPARPITIVAAAALSVCAMAQEHCYFSTSDSTLIDVDLMTCAVVNEVPCGSRYHGLALTADGVLLEIDQEFFRIDPLDCGATLVGGIAAFTTDHMILAMTTRDSTSFFFMCGNSKYLFSFDVVTSDVDTVGWVGSQPIGDLTWHQDDLYLMSFLTGGGTALVRIRLNQALDAVTDYDVMVTYSGTFATGAIATAGDASCLEYCMIAMKHDSIYRFAHDAQASQLVCPGILTADVSADDAASTAERRPDGNLNGLAELPWIENGAVAVTIVLTPDGDGRDDTFSMCRPASGLQRLRITNAFGRIVYAERSHCPVWDGRHRAGAVCSPGYYFYTIEQEGPAEATGPRHGRIAILK